jgi:hypothetical protein
MADRATKPRVDAFGPVDVAIIGGISGGGSFAVRIDEASATITYVGKADVASLQSAAVWQIQRLDDSAPFAITWAGGDDLFDKVWNDRADLTYT